MYIGYSWMYLQGEICRQFSLLTWTSFIGQFIHIVEGKRYHYFSQLRVHFIREHENLMQHPSNNKSINLTL